MGRRPPDPRESWSWGCRVPAGDALVVVLMTAPDAAVAAEIGRALVHERLAACATVVPGVTSIYRWGDALHTDAEAQVLLKTRRALLPARFTRATQLHPYEVPELVALPADATQAYGEWVRGVTSPPSGGGEAGLAFSEDG